MSRLAVLFALTFVLLSACSGTNMSVPSPSPTHAVPSATPIVTTTPPIMVSEPASDGPAWDDLRRPLVLPSIPPGGDCPVRGIAQHTPQYGKGAGEGPFFVTMAYDGSNATMTYTLGDAWVGDWGGQKTLWYADPAYQGRALIRGRRIDGPGEVRFDYVQGASLAAELRVDTREARQPNGQWPSWIGATRLRLDSPGCYAFQVDGDTFTEVIVFRAIHSP